MQCIRGAIDAGLTEEAFSFASWIGSRQHLVNLSSSAERLISAGGAHISTNSRQSGMPVRNGDGSPCGGGANTAVRFIGGRIVGERCVQRPTGPTSAGSLGGVEGRPPCGPMDLWSGQAGRETRVRACSQVVECADAEASEALLLWIDGCPGI